MRDTEHSCVDCGQTTGLQRANIEETGVTCQGCGTSLVASTRTREPVRKNENGQPLQELFEG